MEAIDKDWEQFIEQSNTNLYLTNIKPEKKIISNIHKEFKPKCGDIYISTQTKIAHLNSEVNLYDIFWQIPILEYQIHEEGVVKKQMKVNSVEQEAVKNLEEHIKNCENVISVDIISQINNPNARKTKFKDVRKINIGISKKDLISYRTKKKGAFYNCFVLILRINEKDKKYKEYHVKVFNTGKLELPGIQNTKSMYNVLNKLITILSPYFKTKLEYNKDNIKTVLINSNFVCNYYIDRDLLSQVIKYTYNLHVVYDPCSYPGIQCKFYYNKDYEENNGNCKCKNKCSNEKNKTSSCVEVSFMIFRTGSVLIVGKCNETILKYVYNFIKKILITDYKYFMINSPEQIKKPKSKKTWKKFITLTK